MEKRPLPDSINTTNTAGTLPVEQISHTTGRVVQALQLSSDIIIPPEAIKTVGPYKIISQEWLSKQKPPQAFVDAGGDVFDENNPYSPDKKSEQKMQCWQVNGIWYWNNRGGLWLGREFYKVQHGKIPWNSTIKEICNISRTQAYDSRLQDKGITLPDGWKGRIKRFVEIKRFSKVDRIATHTKIRELMGIKEAGSVDAKSGKTYYGDFIRSSEQNLGGTSGVVSLHSDFMGLSAFNGSVIDDADGTIPFIVLGLDSMQTNSDTH